MPWLAFLGGGHARQMQAELVGAGHSDVPCLKVVVIIPGGKFWVYMHLHTLTHVNR